jgi:hypothetical protein
MELASPERPEKENGGEPHNVPGARSREQIVTLDHQINSRIEALKLIKEWSAGMIVVQSGAIAVVGAMLGTVPTWFALALVIYLLLVLVASIYVGAVAVVGTIPFITQSIPDDPTCDVYSRRGGLKNYRVELAALSLGDQCILQSNLFVLSLIIFSLFVVCRSSQWASGIGLLVSIAATLLILAPMWRNYVGRIRNTPGS